MRFPMLALVLLSIAVHVAQGSTELTSLSITGVSAEWTAVGGYASNLLPQNNPTAATSPNWNSAQSSSYYPPAWIKLDIGAPTGSNYDVSAFEFKSTGDGVHDPDQFELLVSASASGTYTSVGSFTGASGTTAMQVFALSTVTTARYWQFNIINTFSGYQAIVAYVNFFVIYKLNTFTLVSVSSEWTAVGGQASNMLPTNNPTASTSIFWNSAAGSGNYPKPYWAVFNFSSAKLVSQFYYKSLGDTTHDPKNFQLQTATSPTGTWTTVQSFVGTAGTTAFQYFTLTSPTASQYWRLYCIDNYSGFQGWIAYVNFIIG